MRLGPSDRRNVRRLLPRPFLSSPVILITYLILIFVCVGVLEWVLHTSAEALKTKEAVTPQARSVLLRDIHSNTVHTAIEVVPVLVVRQNTSDEDGNSSDTSNGTPTTTNNSGSETTDEPTTTTGGSGSDSSTETDEPNTTTTATHETETTTTSEHESETTSTHESETTTTSSEHTTTTETTTHDDHSNTTSTHSTTTSEASPTSTNTDDDPNNDDDPSNDNDSDNDGNPDDEGYTDDSSDSSSTGNSTESSGFTSLFNDQHSAIPLSDGNREMPTHVNKLVKFTANYATIIIAVFFQTTWNAIFASIKLYEPFNQLAQPGGAPPTTGMLFEFLQTGFPTDHFKAGFLGNWTSWYMITSYLILVLLLVIPSLATEAFSIQNVKGECIDSVKDKCARTVWTVSVKPVRTLEIALVILGILVFAVMMYRVRRGMTTHLNRVTLASISDTLTDPRSVELLRAIPPNTPRRQANLFLSQQNWAFEASSTAAHGAVEPSYILRSTSERRLTIHDQAYGALEKVVAFFTPHSHIFQLIIPALIILILLIIVGSYAGHGMDNSSLVKFFKSASFGPKFFLVGSVAILGLFISLVEYEVRLITIYRTLYASSDPYKLLDRRLHGSPLTQTFSSLYHREWICAYVSGMTGYGIPALAIVIGNVPWHAGQSVANAKGCIFASLALLILFAIALAMVPFWRKGNATLGFQRLPCTLGDIYIMMVHGQVPGIHGSGTDKELMPHGVPQYYNDGSLAAKERDRKQKPANYANEF